MPLAISEVENNAIKTLYKLAREQFKIRKIILFGSKARGNADIYSDIDLLVLTEKVRTDEDRWMLSDLSAEINVTMGVALSCLYFNEKDWEKGENVNPLLKENIEREGVEIVV